MPIEFRCGQCGKLLRTGDETVGRQAQCPACGALTNVPSPPEATPQLAPLGPQIVGSAGVPFGSPPTSGGAAHSDNPYQSPNNTGYTVLPGQPNPFAAQRVSGPATALIVTAILGIIAHLLDMLVNMASLIGGPMADGGADFMMPMVLGGGMVLGVGAFGLVMKALIIIGALKMKRLENYSFAMASAILATIPCISPCCVLGIPFGIWAIVVLNDETVKAAFRS